MTENNTSNVTYLIAGLGVGSLIGVLFAPKSGNETREYLKDKTKAGRGYVEKQAQNLKSCAEGLVERGKEAVVAARDEIATAVNMGREVYRHETARKT